MPEESGLSACPVAGVESNAAEGCPFHKPQSQPQSGCPVPHGNSEAVADQPVVTGLNSARTASSIPKKDGTLWEYPSEEQFYKAMQRKHMSPDAGDMPVIIPIHNAVNEKCWQEILEWEKLAQRTPCDPKLIQFTGTKKLSPRAVWNMALGAQRPFDRHDWVVDRCGQNIDYVIDFYTGKADPNNPLKQSFYLDVRPKLNSLEGIKMRFWKYWSK